MTTNLVGEPTKVLLALDGSPAAATALPLARILAAQLAGLVEVLHVADSQAPDVPVWQRLHQDLGEQEIVHVRSHAGDPAAAILQAAQSTGVEMLVLTTHGQQFEPGRTLGRVAQAVVARARRPILLVRPEASGSQSDRIAPLRRLLLPLDGTPTTAMALQPALALATRLGVSVDLLYVASPDEAPAAETGSIGAPRYVDQPQHEWPAWGERVIGHLAAHVGGRPAGLSIQVFLAHGDIAGEIARFAEEHASDAIVLVRRSHLEVGRAHVLRAVLAQTSCPVLLVGSA